MSPETRHEPTSPQLDFDHTPSLAASFDDFANDSSPEFRTSPTFQMPSQHSGFRSSSLADERQSERESSIDSSVSPWSPPAWRQRASGLFQQHEGIGPSTVVRKGLGSPPRSREDSPLQYRSDYHGGSVEPDEYNQAMRVPLPESPEKQRSPSPSPAAEGGAEEVAEESRDRTSNYVRFSVRADVQHRTDPLDALLLYWHRCTKTWSSLFFSAVSALSIALIAIHITRKPSHGPGPDLIQATGLARSFEPMILYAEHGSKQVSALHDTSIAVWDLGESVRLSNMTSAPIIVAELDALSSSLQSLGDELTTFFATINGDLDNILLAMEWAYRELSHTIDRDPSQISGVIDNLSHLSVSLSRGVLPHFSPIVHELLGLQNSYHGQRLVLARTFTEYLATFEDCVSGELTHAQNIFALFSATEKQFTNLQRAIAREASTQETLSDAELATLWSKLFGRSSSSMSRLRKFERNKDLLGGLRDRTVGRKKELSQANSHILSMKTSLDTLRRSLMSPLIKAENTSSAGIREQIEGVAGTWRALKGVRERQKQGFLGALMGSERRLPTIGEEVGEIVGRGLM
ncbi:MAG: hypothetical protein Q9162_001196 [Coniocarpon cinnabarinum]